MQHERRHDVENTRHRSGESAVLPRGSEAKPPFLVEVEEECGECGGSMYLAHRSPERNKAGWLRCTNASRSNKCTNHTGIAYQPLEESLLREVQIIQSIKVMSV